MKSSLKTKLEYKGDWFQEVQGTMMLVVTVIATVAFQGAINLSVVFGKKIFLTTPIALFIVRFTVPIL